MPSSSWLGRAIPAIPTEDDRCADMRRTTDGVVDKARETAAKLALAPRESSEDRRCLVEEIGTAGEALGELGQKAVPAAPEVPDRF